MDVLLIVFCLVLSAFFSGIEMAFISANRLKIELSNQRGTLSGKILADFVKQPSRFIVTTLLGNNIVLVIFGFLMVRSVELPLQPILGNDFWATAIQTLLSTFILIIFGEYIPKILFKVFADTILPVLALPFYITFWLLRAGVVVIDGLATLILKIFNIKETEHEITFTTIDLEKFIKEHSPGTNSESQEVDTELFENALYLKNLKVRECMVPRREISAIEISEPLSKLKEIIIESYHSRILVYKDNIDNILGYVHHFDLHKRLESIEEILLPINVIPESMPLQKLLNIFIRDNKSIAWVVDEYGGTAGVITLEDILEEIFGEIDDEYDADEYVENQLSDNEYILSGRLEIDHLNEEYELNIPEGEYETLSGFIISHTGSIPENNDEIIINQYTFKIMDVSDTKVETVKLTIRPDHDPTD
jgi:CBS domain containing-hemolysin-like protein